MAYPHEFNLRGPWRWEAQPEDRTDPSSGDRLQLPIDAGPLAGQAFRGTIRFLRSCASPSNLEASEHVWLVLDGVDPSGAIRWNGTELGRVAGYGTIFERDVTLLLERRNELAIEVASYAADVLRPGRLDRPCGLLGNVRLEVRREAYVERLAVACYMDPAGAPAQRLEVRGRIAGAWSRELELQIVAGRREALFQPVAPGEAFHVRPSVAGHTVWRRGEAGADTTAADIVEVRLLSAGLAVWESSTAVRCRAAEPLAAAWPELNRVHFATGPATVDGLRQALPSPIPAEIVSDQILGDSYYEAFERMGLSVVQRVPTLWSQDVLPRLSRHASIAAWLAAPGETPTIETELGRPWLADP